MHFEPEHGAQRTPGVLQPTYRAVFDCCVSKRPRWPHTCVPHCVHDAHGSAVTDEPVSTIRLYGRGGEPTHTLIA